MKSQVKRRLGPLPTFWLWPSDHEAKGRCSEMLSAVCIENHSQALGCLPDSDLSLPPEGLPSYVSLARSQSSLVSKSQTSDGSNSFLLQINSHHSFSTTTVQEAFFSFLLFFFWYEINFYPPDNLWSLRWCFQLLLWNEDFPSLDGYLEPTL